jgi:hypothetical protein
MTDQEKLIIARSLIDTALKDLAEGDSSQAGERLELAIQFLYEIDLTDKVGTVN